MAGWLLGVFLPSFLTSSIKHILGLIVRGWTRKKKRSWIFVNRSNGLCYFSEKCPRTIGSACKSKFSGDQYSKLKIRTLNKNQSTKNHWSVFLKSWELWSRLYFWAGPCTILLTPFSFAVDNVSVFTLEMISTEIIVETFCRPPFLYCLSGF